VDWKDNYYYVQAQGVLDSRQLATVFEHGRQQVSGYRLALLGIPFGSPAGRWSLALSESGMAGRIATAEEPGDRWGCLETYRQTRDRKFLTSVEKWHRFVVREIGFSGSRPGTCCELLLRQERAARFQQFGFSRAILGRSAEASGDDSYLRRCTGLFKFLRAVQEAAGEFPYTVGGVEGGKVWPHFQCFQYKRIFYASILMRYFDLTGDRCRPGLLSEDCWAFCAKGRRKNGRSYFECGDRHRDVTYHTAVLAQAFCASKPV